MILRWLSNTKGSASFDKLSLHACPDPDCDYYGNTDPTFHAVVGDGNRDADHIQ